MDLLEELAVLVFFLSVLFSLVIGIVWYRKAMRFSQSTKYPLPGWGYLLGVIALGVPGYFLRPLISVSIYQDGIVLTVMAALAQASIPCLVLVLPGIVARQYLTYRATE
jgi:hypothetical protein